MPERRRFWRRSVRALEIFRWSRRAITGRRGISRRDRAEREGDDERLLHVQRDGSGNMGHGLVCLVGVLVSSVLGDDILAGRNGGMRRIMIQALTSLQTTAEHHGSLNADLQIL